MSIKTLSIILIACIGILAYSNTFHCSFHYDEIPYIVDNPCLKGVNHLLDIWKFYPCRFITFFSFALNYHFNGLDVFGYHLFNLIVHLVSACLVWWLVLLTLSTPAMKDPAYGGAGNKITKHSNLVALFAGLVFVSHPVQTEAVTYIWQRTASMAGMFYLASLCFYIKSRLTSIDSRFSGNDKNNAVIPAKAGIQPGIYYILSLITAILAMFTKEMTATLPFMILLYEFSFFKRADTSSSPTRWKPIIPFFFILLIVSLIVFLLPKSIKAKEMEGVISGFNVISPMQYLLTQFRVMVTYIRLLFVPIHQNLDYDYPISNSFFELPSLISFLFIALILFFAQRLFLKYRLVSFSIFWFFLTLLPESSVIPLKDLIFEHRLYLPLAGYSVFLVSGAYYLAQNDKGLRMAMAVLTMIIACNTFLTYQRNKVWKDEFTLWDDTVQKSPHKSRPYNNRGIVWAKEGKIFQAVSDFTRAVELDPKNTEAYTNLSHVRQLLRAQELSHPHGRINAKLPKPARQINPVRTAQDFAIAYYNQGLTYAKQGKLLQAIDDYNKTIKINPKLAEAYYVRGTAYAMQGRYNDAIADYNTAIKINPNYAEFYNNRGIVYDRQDKPIQAMSDYDKAIQIKPKLAEAYNNRGLNYYKQGKNAQSIADFNKAIDLNPQFADAFVNRGNAYAKQNNLLQAISDYTKIIGIDPHYVLAYTNRAILYYQLKKYDQAWEDVRKIKELGVAVNPDLIKELAQASGQDKS